MVNARHITRRDCNPYRIEADGAGTAMGRKIPRGDSTVARLLHGVYGLLGKYAMIKAAGAPALDLDEDEGVFLGIASDDVGFTVLASIVPIQDGEAALRKVEGGDKLTELTDLLRGILR